MSVSDHSLPTVVASGSNGMPPATNPLTAAEYFAGIGLVRMGLEAASWKVVYANDICLRKYEMYRGFYRDADNHYSVQDIFDVDPASVPSSLLATCSFPCTDLSLAGNMNGLSGKHSSAFWGFIGILKAQAEIAPPFVLVENVPGWIVSNGGADFRVTVQALNALGYVCDAFGLDALSFTPQSRRRVFLIGSKIHPVQSSLAATLQRPKSLMPESLRRAIQMNNDLNWMYLTLAVPPPPKSSGLSEIVEKLSESDNRWWPVEQVDRHMRMMAESHYTYVQQLIDASAISYRTFYRRRRQGEQRAEVRKDDIAGCLRTAVGGSGKQFILRAGRGQIRMRTMTPREYARLQGVPDKYPITADDNQALTGFGDAVCVPAISWIAHNALQQLLNGASALEEIAHSQPTSA
jgi:DNA (cytosine-5)-methyltransferase 1